MTDALLVYRISALRAYCTAKDAPRPTQPGSQVFSYAGEYYLVMSSGESEIHSRVLADKQLYFTFKKIWQYVSNYYDYMFIYKLRTETCE